GLQLMSGDGLTYMKNLGDPGGFCLAWTFWYLEMRLGNPDVEPKQLMAYCFERIPELKQATDPKKAVITYIRNYTKQLDSAKNAYLLAAAIDERNIYQLHFIAEDNKKLIKKLEDDFRTLIRDRFEPH